jgi:predicted transcriptional regulator
MTQVLNANCTTSCNNNNRNAIAKELYNRALQMQRGKPANMITRNQRAKNSRVDHLISAAANILVRNKLPLTNDNIYEAVNKVVETYEKERSKEENKTNPQSRFNFDKCVQNKIDSSGMPAEQAAKECSEEVGSPKLTDNNTRNASLFSGSSTRQKSSIVTIWEHHGVIPITEENNPIITEAESERIKNASRKSRAARIENTRNAFLTCYEHTMGKL